MEIRDATSDDAAPIVAIYNHYVLTTTISFEEDAVSAAAMRERISDVQNGGLPWLVAVMNGQVVGYAYATKWRVRPAYRFSVESSVYVGRGQAGHGVGSTLYTHLIERLRAAGLRLAIGGIALPNDASVALHQKLGFEKVAHFSEVGCKFGQWLDVGYWQLSLQPPAS